MLEILQAGEERVPKSLRVKAKGALFAAEISDLKKEFANKKPKPGAAP
jgi:hypothetical protein